MLINKLLAAKTVHAHAYDARRQKIEQAYSAENHNIAPNMDDMGRLHAPVDGYALPTWLLNNVDGHYADKVFGKGEFLPVPRYEDDEVSFSNWNFEPTQLRILVDPVKKQLLEDALVTETFKVGYGSGWVKDGVHMCYAYITSPSKRITNLIKVYFATLEQAQERNIQAEREAEKAAAGTAPEGRQTVTGKILSIKCKEDYYGMTWKMMVKLINGSTVYGTLPAALDEAEVGNDIEFTATFEHAEDDSKHAFYKRPSKAKVITVKPETIIQHDEPVVTEPEPVVQPEVEQAEQAVNERVTVRGQLVDVHVVDGVQKMYVRFDNDFTVYGSLPAGLKNAKVGDMVEFTAAFTGSLFTRPTKAKTI